MRKNTKAELVRNLIAAAKAEGIGPEDIVRAAMEMTGHPRQLTRAYIKNNWDKVTDPTETIAAMCAEFTENLPEAAAPFIEELYVEEAEETVIAAPAAKSKRKSKAKVAAVA